MTDIPTTKPPRDDAALVLGVLSAVEQDSAVTQRGLSSDLGIALGLANAVLKRCVRKGLIKIA
ncbi:MAG: winged helix-turn-helix transcriptional regulator, partial [Alphaproteobacteria bacterium]|nr:winged helix-turn-helix transcriptional regulator [Alphaproteobacteria bacterium]